MTSLERLSYTLSPELCAELQALIKERDQYRAVLQEAKGVVHGEFCGYECDEFCKRITQTLNRDCT